MIATVEICDYCKNRLEGQAFNEYGGVCAICKAFPGGIPYELSLEKSEREKGCANGYKFEKGEKRYGFAVLYPDFV